MYQATSCRHFESIIELVSAVPVMLNLRGTAGDSIVATIWSTGSNQLQGRNEVTVFFASFRRTSPDISVSTTFQPFGSPGALGQHVVHFPHHASGVLMRPNGRKLVFFLGGRKIHQTLSVTYTDMQITYIHSKLYIQYTLCIFLYVHVLRTWIWDFRDCHHSSSITYLVETALLERFWYIYIYIGSPYFCSHMPCSC